MKRLGLAVTIGFLACSVALYAQPVRPLEIKVSQSGNDNAVDVLTLPALPTGTNNIGDVDVLSIAAGDNNIGNVDVVTLPSLPAGTNNIGDVDVLTLPAVTNAGTFAVQESGAALTSLQLIDNLVKAEDDASANLDPGVVIFARRTATPANTSGADLDYEALQISAGRLWTSATIDAALPAGTNNIGDVDVLTLPSVTIGTFPDNEPINIAQMNGVAVTMGNGVSGTGVQRVTLASDSTGKINLWDGVDTADVLDLTNANPLTVAMVDGAGTQITSFGGGTEYTEDAATPGDPVGKSTVLRRRDTPAAEVSAAGDWVAANGTNYGAQFVQVVSSSGGFIDTFGGSGGTATTDEGTFTLGTTTITPMGCIEATDTMAAGVVGGVKCGSDRELDVDIMNATLAVTQSGTWNITDITGTVSLPTGASTLAEQQTQTTALQLIDNLVLTEDLASATGQSGVQLLAVRDATPGNTSDTELDLEPLQVNGGRLWVDASGVTLTVGSHAVTNAGTFAVQVDNLDFAEDAVAASGDLGLVALFVREDTPTSTASANGDYIAPKANLWGHLFTNSICQDPNLVTSVVVNGTASGNTELVALTTNQTIYVCGYNFMSSGTSDTRLVYGTGTACATGETGLTGLYPLTAQTGISVPNGGGIQTKTAVSNALCIELSAAVNVRGMVSYVKF